MNEKRVRVFKLCGTWFATLDREEIASGPFPHCLRVAVELVDHFAKVPPTARTWFVVENLDVCAVLLSVPPDDQSLDLAPLFRPECRLGSRSADGAGLSDIEVRSIKQTIDRTFRERQEREEREREERRRADEKTAEGFRLLNKAIDGLAARASRVVSPEEREREERERDERVRAGVVMTTEPRSCPICRGSGIVGGLDDDADPVSLPCPKCSGVTVSDLGLTETVRIEPTLVVTVGGKVVEPFPSVPVTFISDDLRGKDPRPLYCRKCSYFEEGITAARCSVCKPDLLVFEGFKSKERECPNCGGLGSFDEFDGPYDCGLCNGTGERPESPTPVEKKLTRDAFDAVEERDEKDGVDL